MVYVFIVFNVSFLEIFGVFNGFLYLHNQKKPDAGENFETPFLRGIRPRKIFRETFFDKRPLKIRCYGHPRQRSLWTPP